MILLRREDTGGILRVRARRTVGIVEIQNDLFILDRLGVIVPARRIGLSFAGEVPELDEQLVILYFGGVEFIGLALKLKRDISIHAVFDRLAKCIGLVGYLWFRIACITCIEAEVFVDREPLQQRQGRSCRL